MSTVPSLKHTMQPAWWTFGMVKPTELELSPGGLACSQGAGGHSFAMRHITSINYGHRTLSQFFTKALLAGLLGVFLLIAYHPIENFFNYGLRRANVKLNTEISKVSSANKADPLVNLNNYTLHISPDITQGIGIALLGLAAWWALWAAIGQSYLQVSSNGRETTFSQRGKHADLLDFGARAAKAMIYEQQRMK